MVAVLDTVILPEEVIFAAGVRGKNMRQNARTRNQGGYVDAVIIWAQTLRQYEFGFIPMLQSVWRTIIGLHEVTEGGAKGFLMMDPADNFCQRIEGPLVLISGSDFQLHKRYTSVGSSVGKNRKITRPHEPSFELFKNGVTMVDPYSVDFDTGIVNITTPGSDTFTWQGSFYVPVHFADDSLDWDLVLSGDNEDRLVAGPSAVLLEVRE